MTEMKTIFEQLLRLMNIGEFRVEEDLASDRLNIFIESDYFKKTGIPNLINEFNHLGQLIAKRQGYKFNCLDINNYRLERERLITEIAKAAARKAIMTKNKISLPVMNSYERRLIHMELAMRPDVKTESEGEGRTRYVTIKPILD